jgi:DNA-directed RNA polymerase specialized sigma24 family protein
MNSVAGNSPVFVTTQWTIVLRAGGEHSREKEEALEKLCRTYWYPLYVFIRRSGSNQHDAEDLTQAFFARLLEKEYLIGLDRNKGKFRSYLLAAFQHFVANQRREARAQKRGGGCSFIALDDPAIEERFLHSSFTGVTAEQSYERQWAMTLLEQVVARLRNEFVSAGKAALFDELKIFLTGEKRACSYAELAMKLGSTEGALKMTVSRMRQRYGEMLRAEIANTVSQSEEVEEELRALFGALS